MNNKTKIQIFSGALLFFSYFMSWALNRYGDNISAHAFTNLEIYGDIETPFLMKILILVPFFGLANIYLGYWVKKYSYLLNLAIIVIVSLSLLRIGIEFSKTDEIAIGIGYYMAIFGVVVSAYSIFFTKREEERTDLQLIINKAKEELQLIINKAKELYTKLENKKGS